MGTFRLELTEYKEERIRFLIPGDIEERLKEMLDFMIGNMRNTRI